MADLRRSCGEECPTTNGDVRCSLPPDHDGPHEDRWIVDEPPYRSMRLSWRYEEVAEEGR